MSDLLFEAVEEDEELGDELALVAGVGSIGGGTAMASFSGRTPERSTADHGSVTVGSAVSRAISAPDRSFHSFEIDRSVRRSMGFVL